MPGDRSRRARRSAPKSICAPTEMKNRPSSRPLNGSMSLSSSWRYSLSASTTPARKVPSAGDSPTCCMSSAMPTTSSSAAAVNDSRSRALGEELEQRAAPRSGPTHDDADHRAEHEQRRAASAGRAGAPRPPSRRRRRVASSGNSARIGITAMSWNSSTEKLAWPPARLEQPALGERSTARSPSTTSRAISPTASAGLPVEPERERRRRRRRAAVPTTCSAAEPEDRPAQLPEQRRPQLEPDEEQHHHHAELGEVHDVVRPRCRRGRARTGRSRRRRAGSRAPSRGRAASRWARRPRAAHR